ncbi:MAG: YHS domain protein [Bdellovibrionales bacterium]|jgi:hypothetical protein|nr:YHS domain protein [Bdellovibrionales bacterium]
MSTLSKLSISLFLTFFMALTSFSAEARNITEWNLGQANLAIQGYDPVAYFPEGGGEAALGEETLEIEHEGVLYRFTSQDNLNLFLSNPDKYEPAFGGWCATAMSMGQKIVIIPERFIVKGNRLFLFSFLNGNDAKFMWEQNPAGMERRADFNWKKISDEDPRGK